MILLTSPTYYTLPAPLTARLQGLGYEFSEREMMLSKSVNWNVRHRTRKPFHMSAGWLGSPEAVELARKRTWGTMAGFPRPEPCDTMTPSGLPLGSVCLWSHGGLAGEVTAFGRTSVVGAYTTGMVRRGGSWAPTLAAEDYALAEECARWLSAWAEGLDASGAGARSATSLRTVRLRSGTAAVRLADVAASRRLSWRVANGVVSVGP